MRRTTRPLLEWPSPAVQTEWGLLARCLTDPSWLGLQGAEEQERILKLAGDHAVGPLLYYHLETTRNLGGLTDSVVDRLRMMYLRGAARNLVLNGQVSSLGQAFEKAKLPVLFVKGAILASAVYADPALRPMGDIDIVVRPDREDEVLRVLDDMGYVPTEVESFGSFTRKTVHARAFHRPSRTGLSLELHHDLVGGALKTSTEAGWFWEHTTMVTVESRPTLTLNPEATLAHLCAHLVGHHGWNPRFIWVYDIHALLEKYQERFDWGRFTSVVHQLRWEVSCSSALRAAQACLEPPVPETVLRDLDQMNKKSRLTEWQARWPHTGVLQTVADCWGMSDLRSRAQFIWHTLFPSREYMISRYGFRDAHFWPLLYPYRWGIMVREVGRTARILWQVHSG